MNNYDFLETLNRLERAAGQLQAAVRRGDFDDIAVETSAEFLALTAARADATLAIIANTQTAAKAGLPGISVRS